MKFKTIALVIACCLAFTSFNSPSKKEFKCEMAVTYAEMAYKDFRKAYDSDSMEESLVSINKGVEEATQSSAYAVQCDCANAKNYALNAVTFGKKAAKADDLKERKKFTKKAMDMSLDVLTAVPACK